MKKLGLLVLLICRITSAQDQIKPLVSDTPHSYCAFIATKTDQGKIFMLCKDDPRCNDFICFYDEKNRLSLVINKDGKVTFQRGDLDHTSTQFWYIFARDLQPYLTQH